MLESFYSHEQSELHKHTHIHQHNKTNINF